MNLINLEDITKSYGLKTLLDKVSLGVQKHDRIGVVGLNGGGKTTLLEILSGLEEPDSGRVSHISDLALAVVTQRAELDPEKTIQDVVLEPLGLETYEWAANASVREVLGGLGIVGLGLDTRVGELSGGERRRVNLAAALVQDLDLVILDEPTNHLDVEGVQWLANYLISRRVALVVVTHDRWFLDTVATTTWEVHDGQVDVYEGGYNDWIFARAERTRQASAAEARRRNLARKELAWLRRGAPARTSKPKYRIEAAEALIADVPNPRNSVELLKFAQRRQGKVVIELEDARIDTPDGRMLVKDLTWRLAPGERLGLVGVNGSGKTTLLRTLAGEYPLSQGKRIIGQTARIGWLRQELDDLDPNMRVLEAVQNVASYVEFAGGQLSASQLLERLGFEAKRQRTPVKDLSGGERRRLQLTCILMDSPNILLLDEPTNDLDIDTLQELESLLDSWAGTLVVISHDRYLIERIADTTWALFGDGHLTNLPGGIEQYLERRAADLPTGTVDLGNARERHSAPDYSGSGSDSGSSGSSADAVVTTATAAPASTLSAQEHRELRKSLNRIERDMRAFDKKIATTEVAMAKASEEQEFGKLAELSAQVRTLKEDRDALELEWLEKAEKLEG
ncbi:ABC-F family ATP-binding cassette domain-containing protein [Corynebacterium caspium]|uniref:ABC-F family ATP-binding cassette domain-containing protein n=1 Tax=Corynebacterium caspium TaxID=234828 RepID=UPI00036AEB46|nr:ABC-F family ATP-binding cassette domain-containing protein [Corynebacterium caspium]WKD59599.1 putative ABC transporter ATP-binding protein [Corynebacterium caspium DSM 44850]